MEQIHTDSICENLCHLWMIFVVIGVSRSCGLFWKGEACKRPLF